MEQGQKTDANPQMQEETENLVFYYSRERRLSRAPQQVQNLYGTSGAKKTTINRFPARRSNGILLFTIAIVFIFLYIVPRLAKDKNVISLGGNRISVATQTYSDTTYITLRKEADGANPYTGPVELAVSIAQGSGRNGAPSEPYQVENQRVLFSSKPLEEFGFTVPFAAPRLIILFKAGEALESISVK